MFTCNTICVCPLLPKSFICLLQSRNSISERCPGLSEIPERNIVFTDQAMFRIVAYSQPVTRYDRVNLVGDSIRIFVKKFKIGKFKFNDRLQFSSCKEAFFLAYSDVRSGRLCRYSNNKNAGKRPKYYHNWAQTLFYYAPKHVRPRIFVYFLASGAYGLRMLSLIAVQSHAAKFGFYSFLYSAILCGVKMFIKYNPCE